MIDVQGNELRRAAKIDSNHSEIVDALRQCGAFVTSLAAVGKGCPDLLVGFRGRWMLIEVKDGDKSPSRRELTDWQKYFHAQAFTVGCGVHIVNSVDEAIALLRVE